MDAVRAAHPGKRLTLWCQDEARVGQKGRVCHRWFTRGQRPSGLCDQRYTWAHLFAAVQPATGQDFALVLPEVSTRAMQMFLDQFAATLDADEHAVMLLDQAGWHGAHALVVPNNVTLVPLPPYAPQPWRRARHANRARLVVLTGAPSLPSPAQRLRRHRGRLLRRLEPAHPGTPALADQLPLPATSQLLGSAV